VKKKRCVGREGRCTALKKEPRGLAGAAVKGSSVPTEHFKSKEAYRKSRAYTHIHGIPTHAKDVVVAGKRHKVKHGKRMPKRRSGRR